MIKSALKSVLLELHSIIGLLLSLVLAVIGITGAIMSFEDEIQANLNAAMTQVEARATLRLAPDELVTRLQAEHGFGKLSGMTMSSDPAAAVRIRFARSADRARPFSVYVDPYDARLLGTPHGEEFFATVRRLHRWLLIPGDGNGYGRQITGIAVLGLVALMISGLVLRWPHRATSIKLWLKPNLALSGRGLHRSLHTVIGTWVLPIYLVMALTGLWYSFDWYKSGATWLLSRPGAATATMARQPPRTTRTSDGRAGIKSEERPEGAPISLDRAWEAFLHAQGDRYASAQLIPPQGAGTVVRIRSWPHGAADGARDEFRIDAATGQILASELYADKTTGERILARVLDIHRGSVLGWPGKLLFMLAAAVMPLFVVTGLLLYLSRRRHRRLVRTAPRPSLVPGE
ncbi:PepSY-associated TM helix domain-containing protein [Bradyrhizobium sp. HKCCYLS1011]|uniref:PepSY-associated TM helix domain-containing protein n=1 Tax=Bradyrhizobium sp. HKCCYLS1011 TaxID=3420733 RepID=UPI003EBAE198